MKHLTLTLLTTLFLGDVFAQTKSDPKTYDLGVTMSRFSFESIPLNFVLKWGQDQKFWRLEASNIGGTLRFPERTNVDQQVFFERKNTLGLGLSLAREFRKSINDQLTFFHGPEAQLSASYSDQYYLTGYSAYNAQYTNRHVEYQYRITGRLGYSLGCIFTIGQNLYLSFDLAPNVYYRYTFDERKRIDVASATEESYSLDENQIVGLNFTQGAARFGLFYTFTK